VTISRLFERLSTLQGSACANFVLNDDTPSFGVAAPLLTMRLMGRPIGAEYAAVAELGL
jgi:hypothetical protein